MNEYELCTKLRAEFEKSYGSAAKTVLLVQVDPARCTPGVRSLLERDVVVKFVPGKGAGQMVWDSQTAEVEL